MTKSDIVKVLSSYKLNEKVISEINVTNYIDLDINLKWKSTFFYDDFLSLDNWTNSGGWNIEDGSLLSQESFLYDNWGVLV